MLVPGGSHGGCLALSPPAVLAFEEPRDVVVKSVGHDEDQQDDADLLRALALLFPHRTAKNRLDEKEKQMAAVEDRDRKQIQHAEVDAEKRDEKKKRRHAFARLLPRHLGDEQ